MNTLPRTVLKSFALGAMLCLSHLSYANENTELSGVWRSIDDKTGQAKSLIKIEKNSNGLYGGRIIKVLPRVGHKPEEFCIDCPAPFTGKPIEGLNILSGLKANSGDDGTYEDGKILDPLSGRIYSAKVKVNADGKKLVIRGFIGISLLGRSQTWYREDKTPE